MPKSSGIEFLERFLAKNFALLDVEDNSYGPLNKGGVADLFLLRKLFAKRQPSFWEVMDSFALLACASLAASKTLLQQLLAYLNFTLDSANLFCWYKWKKKKKKEDFYQLWQEHKQLKTMKMSKGWPDTYNDGYIQQFQPEPTQKIY